MQGKYKIRILHLWMSRGFVGIFIFRTERALFLLFGKSYGIIRILFLPLFYLFQSYSNIDIHYKADIKGGLLILHPSVGIVISGLSEIGHNLTLTGGNIIGGRKHCKRGELIIGNNCSLGANAVILGPVIIGNDIQVGASACVIDNCYEDNSVLVGVPARPVKQFSGIAQPKDEKSNS
jgi:serine O-acetyltransferase